MTTPFHELAASLDYPMAIVTTAAEEGERSGCLVGFSTQCSVKPPRLLVCLSKLNHTHQVAARATALAVHFPTVADCGIAALFGEETGDEVDKFDQCAWRPGPDGRTPLLEDIGRWVYGRVLERIDLGDHTGYLIEPVASAFVEGEQLGFQAVKEMDPGHPL